MSAPINEYMDPQTGEKVKKCLIPEYHQKDIEEGLKIHQNNLNQLLMASQQYFGVLGVALGLMKSIQDSDKGIKERLMFACKKIGISHQDAWNYNMVEKVFELREPPLVMPLASDLMNNTELLKGYDVKNPMESKVDGN